MLKTKLLFLSVISTLFLAACGGGNSSGGGEGSPRNVAGGWSYSWVDTSNTCGEPLEQGSGTLTLSQNGNQVAVNVDGATFSAEMNGSTLSWTDSYSEDGGTTTETASLTLNSDGQYASGNVQWQWTNGTESCSGAFSLEIFCNAGECLADNSGNGSNSGTGTLSLSGADTASVGTSLQVGPVTELQSSIPAILAVDINSTLTNGVPSPGNINDAFAIVVSDGGVSMTILKEGIEYDYACSDTGSFISCGNLTFNSSGKTATFNNVTVENTDSGSELTLNGTISW